MNNKFALLTFFVTVLMAIPAAINNSLQLHERWRSRRREKTGDAMEPTANTKTSPVRYISWKKIVGIHLLALSGISAATVFSYEMMTTFPQLGFSGVTEPAPPWQACLLLMPCVGIAFSWVFLSMIDTFHALNPNDFRKPYTKEKRIILSLIMFLLATPMPWVVFFFFS